MLPAAVDRAPLTALQYCTSGFVDDVMFHTVGLRHVYSYSITADFNSIIK